MKQNITEAVKLIRPDGEVVYGDRFCLLVLNIGTQKPYWSACLWLIKTLMKWLNNNRADGQIDECEIFDDATASEPVKVT